MDYEKFGNGFIQREDADDEWRPVPADDVALAAQALVDQAKAITRLPRMGTRIILSARNETIAARLGLDAEQLADRLAKPDQNQGTGRRVADFQFDEAMREIDLDPDEARDRFTGRYWQAPSSLDKSDHKAEGV